MFGLTTPWHWVATLVIIAGLGALGFIIWKTAQQFV
jgi:hypothetical protein